jgi:hypothetical protein
MTRLFFNQQFAAMVAAYTIRGKLADETQDVYWEMLKDIPHEKFAKGVQECLAQLKFFPSIAELGAASLPPIRDYKAPIPPVDQPFKMLNWREQIERNKKTQLKLKQEAQKQIGHA